MAIPPSDRSESAAPGASVRWRSWGAGAFREAEERGVPVLLSIGAPWCHWCHVMDDECYADSGIAGRIEERFVPVRVDRDERPDLDARYQAAVAQLTGSSGWPLTAFLTAEGGVFFGGTYFSRRPEGTQPGFEQILTWASELHRSGPEKRAAESRRLRDSLASQAVAGARVAQGSQPAEPARAVLDGVLDEWDRRSGGFGAVPKFLHPGPLDLCIRAASRWGHPVARDAALRTIDSMLRAAVHDRVGGGFHRYAVDERFEEPHFEKLLPSNAEMLHVLARAHALEPKPTIREAAEGVARFLVETLQDAGGGFAGSQSADGSRGNGSAFIWTRAELRRAAGAEDAELTDHWFELEGSEASAPSPLVERREPREIARRLGLPEEEIRARMQEVLRRLRAARGARGESAVEGRVLPAPSALAASALAEAAHLLARPEWVDPAERAIARILSERERTGGRVVRGSGAPRLLEDCIAPAEACVHLFERTASEAWLDAAESLLAEAVGEFFDEGAGLLRDRSGPPEGIAGADWARHPLEDGGQTAGNAIGLRALERFLRHREDAGLRSVGSALGASLARAMQTREPLAVASAASAVDRWLRPDPRAIVVGGRSSDDRAPLLAVLRRHAAVACLEGRSSAEAARLLGAGAPAIDVGGPDDSTQATALVCLGRSCAPPATTPAELESRLSGSPA